MTNITLPCPPGPVVKPIDMVLYCPRCNAQHVDAPEPDIGWYNPPHRSHLCAKCNHIWRPADVETNGVSRTVTRGKEDSPITTWRGGPIAQPLIITCAKCGIKHNASGAVLGAINCQCGTEIILAEDNTITCVIRETGPDLQPLRDAFNNGDPAPPWPISRIKSNPERAHRIILAARALLLPRPLVERLRDILEDPMYADHTTITKATLLEAINAIESSMQHAPYADE